MGLLQITEVLPEVHNIITVMIFRHHWLLERVDAMINFIVIVVWLFVIYLGFSELKNTEKQNGEIKK